MEGLQLEREKVKAESARIQAELEAARVAREEAERARKDAEAEVEKARESNETTDQADPSDTLEIRLRCRNRGYRIARRRSGHPVAGRARHRAES